MSKFRKVLVYFSAEKAPGANYRVHTTHYLFGRKVDGHLATAVKNSVTLGEICETLTSVFGRYRP